MPDILNRKGQEVKKIIDEQIKQYYQNSDTLNIEILLRMQDVLSSNYYFYVEIYKNTLNNYIKSYGEYRTEFAKSYLENLSKKIAEKVTSKQAEEIARETTLDKWSKQMFDNANIESLKLEFKGIDKVLNAINQRISALKSEKQNIK